MNTSVKTVFPYLVENNIVTSVELFQKYTTYLQVVQGFTAQLSAFLAYNTANTQGDFVTSTAKFYTDLDKQLATFDNDFIAYWVKEYNTSVGDIKTLVAEKSNQNSFFVELSDSIGILTNIAPLLTESVEPINDLTFADYPAPTTYSVTLESKIRANTKVVAEHLSSLTTASYRRNIVNIQIEYATSHEAHGSNLVTDVASLVRLKPAMLPLTQTLNQQFDQVFKLVSYYCTINDAKCYNPGDVTTNKQLITNLAYGLTENRTLRDVDLIGNNLQPTMHSREISVLSTKPSVAIATVSTPSLSKLTAPLNSTGKATSTITKIPTPAKNKRPTDLKQVQDVGNLKKISPANGAAAGVSKLSSKLPNVMPEYNRGAYAFAGTSPFGIIRAIKAAKATICSIYNKLVGLGISLSNLGKLKFPPTLPNIRLNFSFKKIITGLAIKVQKAIIAKILSLIPPFPKIPDFSKILKQFNKDMFKCNPNNKR